MMKAILLVVLGLLLISCAAPVGDSSTTTAIELERPVNTASDDTGRLVQAAVEARADLASRLDVTENEIIVSGLSSVTWRDGSIGCPEEGMLYSQALVDGALIVLEYNGDRYSYHQAKSGEAFYCEEPAKDAQTEQKKDNVGLEMIPPPGFDE